MDIGQKRTRPLRAGDVQFYRLCEDLSEALIYLMVIFSPWAFGTTQPWAIWSMNAAGYLLGLLLAAKLTIRWFKGYRAARWDCKPIGPQDGRTTEPQDRGTTGLKEATRTRIGPVVRWSGGPVVSLARGLVVLMIAILGYCLTGALNARATYHPAQLAFDYHRCIQWLPHSLDSSRTWFAFWGYLAMACSFWAVRDWLLGKSESEERAERSAASGSAGIPAGEDVSAKHAGKDAGAPGGFAPLLPARLRRLLWVLAINGALLGLEGVAQRMEGSGKLLFLIKPRVNPEGITQFGPYAYRANAAQYFNLMWPVCLGFWWTIHRAAGRGERRGGKSHHLLLVCAVIMAGCPFVTTSRGGAMVTMGLLALAAVLLPAAHFLLPQARGTRQSGVLALALIGICLATALSAGYWLGWKALKPRLSSISEDLEGREETYTIARQMAVDYPLFGTGPGTFDTVFGLYLGSTGTYRPAQLHNDWLETRITFGWIGSAMIAMAFATVVTRWFVGGGIHGGRRFVLLIWLAMAGCLLHARYDFPFQIFSIVFLFLVLCAVLFSLSRRGDG